MRRLEPEARLQSEALDDICRRIREDEPPKPSTRLSTMTHDERGKIANKRKVEPDKLGRLIRGELDWMVMKALISRGFPATMVAQLIIYAQEYRRGEAS